MTISYKNTFRDTVSFMAYHHPRQPVNLVLAGIVIVLTTWSITKALPPDTHGLAKVLTIIIGEGLILGIFILLTIGFLILSMASKKNRSFHTEHVITISESGFIEETKDSRTETKWSGIQRVSRIRKYIFVYIAQHMAHVIPRRAFSTTEEWDTFYRVLVSSYERNA